MVLLSPIGNTIDMTSCILKIDTESTVAIYLGIVPGE